jgi:hypothetical protein
MEQNKKALTTEEIQPVQAELHDGDLKHEPEEPLGEFSLGTPKRTAVEKSLKRKLDFRFR